MGFALDERKQENDIIVESNGIKLVYIEDLEGFLSDKTVDYSEEWYKKGFSLSGSGSSSCS